MPFSGDHVKLIILLLLMFHSYQALSLEYNSQIICTGKECKEKNKFHGLKEKELKISDLYVDECLVDLKTEKVSRIEIVDSKSQKVVILSEKSDHPTTIELSREIIWFNSKEFNRFQKIISCSEVSGILGDELRLKKCVRNNGKSVRSLFCEKERLKNL